MARLKGNEMKTAKEFAEEASSCLVGITLNMHADMNVQRLISFFQRAIDQSSLTWKDGPPMKKGMFVCKYKNGSLTVNIFSQNTIESHYHDKRIISHIGPILYEPN